MSTRPNRVCSYPGCGNASDQSRCPEHRRPQTAGQPENRASSYARGYDRRWARWSAWFLGRHPECHDCGAPSNETHHIVKVSERSDLKYVESNCMALCHVCHSRRTARGE
jgi:5-methylcytosine-specific restriction protein A